MSRHEEKTGRVKLLLLVAFACLCGLSVAGSASSATADDLTQMNTGYGDFFYNYDFLSDSVAWNNVDWGMSLLFYNNAEINKVKGQVGGYWAVGSTMHAYMWNNGTWGPGFDTDAGKKTDTPSCFGSTRHFRIYAPPTTDRFYNQSYGYYVVASTHYDHHELCDSWFDDSEGTEGDVGSDVGDNGGNAVFHDYGWFNNHAWHNEGNHHWRQDGYATYVYVS